MKNIQKSKVTSLIAFGVVSLTVACYYTSLQSPMKASQAKRPLRVDDSEVEHHSAIQPGVIPATPYTGMAQVTLARRNQTLLTSLKSMVDPLAEFKIEPGEKGIALNQRDQNRAYNGAPPTIPHPIDQISDASCVACHRFGVKTQSLRISRMPHQFLTNCTQCHVESNPRHLEPIVFRENNFEGLDAPREGPRAFSDAPPQIPHATWMRSNCTSCHGTTGLQGLRTTHPWRNNCQQCHAPSAERDQTFLVTQPQFLQGPQIEK